MKVLVVGGGGREHAIVTKLRESPKITQIFAAPGNGGIAKEAVCADIKATDIVAMTAFAEREGIGFAIVTPDDPLVAGMVDALEARGIRCFGPDKAAARIEGSKVFSKALMKKYSIPTAEHESFDSVESAMEYARTAQYPLWIKTDGLALGKGAVQAANAADAESILTRFMVEKAFGDSGSRVIMEEHMSGTEVTVLAFCDGTTLRPMVSAMDHKRALDGDMGLNTGGMGTIAPNPHYTEAIAAVCMDEIFIPTVRAMQSEGAPFKGCLYFGLMLTPQGPKVVEYNCRFGDPEAQVVLSLLETDLFEIMLSVNAGTLANMEIKWKSGAAACIVLASGGYPEAYETGFVISGLDGIDHSAVYHAGTRKASDGTTVTSGGRVLGVTAAGGDLQTALTSAYEAASKIHFTNVYYRKDIGRTAL